MGVLWCQQRVSYFFERDFSLQNGFDWQKAWEYNIRKSFNSGFFNVTIRRGAIMFFELEVVKRL